VAAPPGGPKVPESTLARLGRRWTHLTRHPLAWARYVWLTEVRHKEVRFIVNPRFADWGPMWRVSRAPLGRLLGTPPETLDGIFAELAPVHRALLAEAGPVPSAGALMQAPLLYVMVRATRPHWIVETGISSGYSARLILEALQRNGDGGHLDSIGIDVFGLTKDRLDDPAGMGGRRIGWLIPPSLQSNWSLHLGTSEEHLPKLLAARTGPLDVFLHDSLHKYPTMRWEYTTAWPRIPVGGFLASHDVHANRAWPEFVGEHGLSGADEELDHDLGVVRRSTA
jgi:hypothetical protein